MGFNSGFKGLIINKIYEARIVFMFRAKQYKNNTIPALIDREDECSALP